MKLRVMVLISILTVAAAIMAEGGQKSVVLKPGQGEVAAVGCKAASVESDGPRGWFFDVADDLAGYVLQTYLKQEEGGGADRDSKLSVKSLSERYGLEEYCLPDEEWNGAAADQVSLPRPAGLRIQYYLMANRFIERLAKRAKGDGGDSSPLESGEVEELLRMSAGFAKELAACREKLKNGEDAGRDCADAERIMNRLLQDRDDADETIAAASALLSDLAVRLERKAESLSRTE